MSANITRHSPKSLSGGILAKANSNPQTNTPSEIRSVALYARVSTVRDLSPSPTPKPKASAWDGLMSAWMLRQSPDCVPKAAPGPRCADPQYQQKKRSKGRYERFRSACAAD